MKAEFRDICTRLENADEHFIGLVCETFGKTTAEAEKVLRVFRKAKAVKRAVGIGRWELAHGAFWEAEVIDRAIALEEK